MSAKNRPYEQFGSFILFKKLETDALGDLWRAGRVDNGQLGPTLAVRRLLGKGRGYGRSPIAAIVVVVGSRSTAFRSGSLNFSKRLALG